MNTTYQMCTPLDVLIYAHDGRGIGHVSRSVGIGLALRRRYPDLRVLLVSGSSKCEELIGGAPLDWIKLPSYRTEVVEGKSRGIDGYSGYSDHDLGILRREQIRQIFSCYRPRVVLADHAPQGKHKELKAALETSEAEGQTTWILGMRGVIGTVSQTSSPLAVELFRRTYTGLLWYGDRSILGSSHFLSLATQFSCEPVECGYVSRLREVQAWNEASGEQQHRYRCTISVPWVGEKTELFLKHLFSYLSTHDQKTGTICIYLGDDVSPETRNRFTSLAACRVEPFGSSYLTSLLQSETALIFGGYNSLIDVLSIGIPALVVLRDMQDREQQLHLSALAAHVNDHLMSIEEKDCLADPRLSN